MLAKPTFDQLYRDFLGRIYAFLRAQLATPEDAEDVTAQVFLKAYEAYPRYRPEGTTPAAWLFQIARNAARDHRRRTYRRDRLWWEVARQPVAEVDPSELATERVANRGLLLAVSQLPARQREVVSLRHAGLSFAEVGQLLDCSEDAAKMAYHRALKNLRAALAEEAR